MTTKDEALQMALEALTCNDDDDGDDRGHRCGQCDYYVDRDGPVLAAIRAALAQIDDQEPVAWQRRLVEIHDALSYELGDTVHGEPPC